MKIGQKVTVSEGNITFEGVIESRMKYKTIFDNSSKTMYFVRANDDKKLYEVHPHQIK